MTPLEFRIAVLENQLRALDLWQHVFPPWRWPQWWREYKAVKARHHELIAESFRLDFRKDSP